MKKLITLSLFAALLALNSPAQGVVTDYDGHTYDTVMIANRAWLKQNLRTTHYRNGVAIPGVPGSVSWSSLTSGARCYYDNDSSFNDTVYGVLYNWFAVNNTNGLCPGGWHVPTDLEWTDMVNALGGVMVAGGALKEAGTLHWLSPNTGATNASGFTGLPGGMLDVSYAFNTLGENGLWWASTMQGPTMAYSRYFYFLNAGVDRNPTPKSIGLSVRCIRDIGVGSVELQPLRVRLSPNPATDRLTAEWAAEGAVRLRVTDMQGRIVLDQRVDGPRAVVDLRGLAPGVYGLEVKAGSGEVRTSFIKL